MSSIHVLEEELRIASKILEWEIGDIFGHVGVRLMESIADIPLPGSGAIGVKLFRPPEDEPVDDWLVYYDFSLKKLWGVGAIPNEATIYTEIFKARPDVNAIVHSHAPMCIALSLADKPITVIHLQSGRFRSEVPIYPRPILILDEAEGADLARALGQAPAVVIKGHGIVTVGASIDEACINALYLERTAKIQAIAHALGFSGPGPAYIEAIQATQEKMLAQLRAQGRRRPVHSPEWTYYADKVKKGEPWSRGWT